MRNISNLKASLIKVLLIGGCLTIFFATSALAAVEEDPSLPVQGQAVIDENDLLQKQQEIDNYFAGQGRSELEQQGFSVTNTGPVNDVVEVGITPYEDRFAEFLYEKFGRENVRVVEGQQAVTLDSPLAVSQEIAAPENVSENLNGSTGSSNSPLVLYTIGGIIVLVGFLLVMRKWMFARK